MRAICILVVGIALSACTQTRIERPYGNDMLPAGGASQSYGNDMLASAEVTAFQAVDAHLRYRDARIEYDARNCAIYQGIGPDGRVYRELLRNPDNTTICRP
ncbi:hypothetical protein [Antarcticirhabdus aurantiaca]|uniref:Uncharacterized protein n=1 Tax=Antarcticirhabdus aurantiaca TaxID=2606717 RepID=A0ACD4NIG0_9HYPH|nr:hypothetical protein [Antarcticirhabdus aurantiaca]WAJ26637.1 hypothetical protein OXU80_17385 [Jeongeuplla avenae]